jgi:hypothetical protein
MPEIRQACPPPEKGLAHRRFEAGGGFGVRPPADSERTHFARRGLPGRRSRILRIRPNSASTVFTVHLALERSVSGRGLFRLPPTFSPFGRPVGDCHAVNYCHNLNEARGACEGSLKRLGALSFGDYLLRSSDVESVSAGWGAAARGAWSGSWGEWGPWGGLNLRRPVRWGHLLRRAQHESTVGLIGAGHGRD